MVVREVQPDVIFEMTLIFLLPTYGSNISPDCPPDMDECKSMVGWFSNNRMTRNSQLALMKNETNRHAVIGKTVVWTWVLCVFVIFPGLWMRHLNSADLYNVFTFHILYVPIRKNLLYDLKLQMYSSCVAMDSFLKGIT